MVDVSDTLTDKDINILIKSLNKKDNIITTVHNTTVVIISNNYSNYRFFFVYL
jgi:hypothetical protein